MWSRRGGSGGDSIDCGGHKEKNGPKAGREKEYGPKVVCVDKHRSKEDWMHLGAVQVIVVDQSFWKVAASESRCPKRPHTFGVETRAPSNREYHGVTGGSAAVQENAVQSLLRRARRSMDPARAGETDEIFEPEPALDVGASGGKNTVGVEHEVQQVGGVMRCARPGIPEVTN